MPQLFVLDGPDSGRTFDLPDGSAVVGRLSTNVVVLSDPRVSRKHFELVRTPAGVHLTDLGSGNGTLVNGVAVQAADLRPGDRLQAGDTVFEFRDETPPPHDHTRIVVRAEVEAEAFKSAVRHTLPADEGSRMLVRPDAATSDWLRGRLANLTALYEVTAAVSEILDVDELLGRIVELVVRSTDADHGCVLLQDADSGALMPKAARSRAGGGEVVVSRTVAEFVLKERQGVLVADAAGDERFRAGMSIAQHRIREVICVPMKGRHGTVGVLFLDTLAPAGLEATATFTEDHLKLAAAVAHQAALAVEETRYYQALIQAERLAAVGQTIAGLSHHIKNIMQGVRFGGDMVRMGLDDGDRELLLKGWRLVEKNQARIDELILDMLSFSKEREPALEPADLASLAADVLEVVRGRADDNGVSLELTADPLPPVACDPDGVHRALLNVVSNAVDAVTGRDAPRVAVHLTPVDGFAEIRVTDNGPGLPADKRADIFKPFVSTKGSRGTGLGLPVSRKTLREHGGDVTADDADGGGAVFTLRLPLTGATSP
ncbi:MAG: ATP-binding protein [Gemmataceae bacterium]